MELLADETFSRLYTGVLLVSIKICVDHFYISFFLHRDTPLHDYCIRRCMIRDT